MSKRITITPTIQAQIRAALGDENLDTSKLAVFQAKVLSTEKIKRKAGLFAGARTTHDTLVQMANVPNSVGGAIPIQIMHDTSVTPVGKLFHASVDTMKNGESELNTLFYLPESRAELINDIETGVIDEVSVGLLSQHLYCSECKFDYRGEEATFMNIMDLTCNNDHTIGQNGVHVIMSGMEQWSETSLVGAGAATDAKILGRARQRLPQNSLDKLAASGVSLENTMFVGKFKMNDENPEETEMVDEKFVALLQAKTDEVATLKAEFTAVTKEVDTLKAANATLTSDNEKLTVELTALKADDKTAQLAAQLEEANTAKAELSAATEALLPHVKAALVASGESETTVPSDLKAMLALVETKGLKLHQLFASTATSDATPSDVELKAQAAEKTHRAEAFKTKRF